MGTKSARKCNNDVRVYTQRSSGTGRTDTKAGRVLRRKRFKRCSFLRTTRERNRGFWPPFSFFAGSECNQIIGLLAVALIGEGPQKSSKTVRKDALPDRIFRVSSLKASFTST